MGTGHDLITQKFGLLLATESPLVPDLIHRAGPSATKRFVEFFTANIRNRGTREVYARAIGRFCRWCELRRFSLEDIEPIVVAAYIEPALSEKLRRLPMFLIKRGSLLLKPIDEGVETLGAKVRS